MASLDLQQLDLDIAGRPILRGITFSLPVGACCGLIGPNGCGKSTLARVLGGYLWPTRGRVEVLGHRLGEISVHQLRRHVQLVQRDIRPPRDSQMTVRQVILTGHFGTIGLFDEVSAAQVDDAGHAAERMGVAGLLEQRFDTLSAGETSRTLIARALVARPRLLLLDEPAAGLDLPGREALLQRLDSLHADDPSLTTLMVTHHLEELPAGTSHAVMMAAGRLITAGPVAEALTEASLSAVMGMPIAIHTLNGRRLAMAR